MRLREVPYWLNDRDCEPAAHLLDHDVVLGWTDSIEDTAPFDDVLTHMMTPIFMRVGPHAFPPVVMAPGCLPWPGGRPWLSGAHRLRAAYFAGLPRIPAYLVQGVPVHA